VRVILIRHAEAAPGNPDAERQLTAAGHDAAKALAARIAPEQPGAVFSSPLLRARQTATPIAEAAGVHVEVDHRLAPGADVESLREVTTGRAGTVVVVGHEPDCGQIAKALTGETVRFPPGGTCDLEL
jgi:phosphohistidine phosphatase